MKKRFIFYINPINFYTKQIKMYEKLSIERVKIELPMFKSINKFNTS